MHQYFMECGEKLGTSKSLLNYIWDTQFKLSFGYSFSSIHTTGYSLIALQEMNLAYHYPIIFWNCACLSVDSSAISSQDFYNLIDDEVIEIEEDVEGKKAQNKMDYSKLVAALDRFKHICKIETPDLNNSRLSFTPDKKNNTILYGLKGISRVTEPVIQEIMDNRPFSSLQDFLNRTTSRIVTKDKVINLIKCGAFDRIEHKTRREILADFIHLTSEQKKQLTMQNANMLIDFNLLPSSLDYESNVYKLTKELRKHRDKGKMWYKIDALDIPYDKIDLWKQIFKDSKIDSAELILDDVQGVYIDSRQWDRFYDTNMLKIRSFIQGNHNDLLNALNNKLFENEWNKYCLGDELQWELDSINFYFSGHPLEKSLSQIEYNIDKIENIIEGDIEDFFLIKGKQIPKMKLYTLLGTVVDRDKVKGLVTIQTTDGVINIKCYKELYAIYAQQISTQDEDGNKIVEEESFFEKGVHLLITGIQRGSTFIPKVYKNTGRRAIVRVLLDENNNFIGLQEKQGA